MNAINSKANTKKQTMSVRANNPITEKKWNHKKY